MPSSVDVGANTRATIQFLIVISENIANVVATRTAMTELRRGAPFAANQHNGQTTIQASNAVDRVMVVKPLSTPLVSAVRVDGVRHSLMSDAAVVTSSGTQSDSLSGCRAINRNFHHMNAVASGSATDQTRSSVNSTAISTSFQTVNAASSR